MRLPLFAATILWAGMAVAAGPAANETLNYAVNWPSGLSLGEAQIEAKSLEKSPERWEFKMRLEAAIPAFAVADAIRSVASGAQFCSSEFEKKIMHGKKAANETTRFDQQTGIAVRETKSGGKSEINAGTCARDALTFLQFLRRELAAGRLPGPQTVYFGAGYQVRLEYGGTRAINLPEGRKDADRVVATIKGPASTHTVELMFSKDAAKLPLQIRVPFALGTFSMELVR